MATFVTRQANRIQTPAMSLDESREDVTGVPTCREADGDVARPAVGDQLTSEDELESDVIAKGSYRRLVSD